MRRDSRGLMWLWDGWTRFIDESAHWGGTPDSHIPWLFICVRSVLHQPAISLELPLHGHSECDAVSALQNAEGSAQVRRVSYDGDSRNTFVSNLRFLVACCLDQVNLEIRSSSCKLHSETPDLQFKFRPRAREL